MILALVFFILAAAVLGVTTYLGYKDADQWEKAASDAKKDKDTAVKNQTELQLRLAVNHRANGIELDPDQVALQGAGTEGAAVVADEKTLLNGKLGGSFPAKGDFGWPDGAVAPNKTIPAITRLWAKMAQDMKKQRDDAADARKKAEDAAKARQDEKDKAVADFEQKLAQMTKDAKDYTDKMDKQFLALKTEAEKAGGSFKKQAEEWAALKASLDETINVKNLELKSKDDKIRSLQNPDASDILWKWQNSFNVAKTAERMGTISDKSGTFVTINFANAMHIVPGQTFVVIPQNGSLVEVIDREKALEKHHHEHVSLGPRDPFADNEMIKGMVEITDVIGQYAARARITYQSNEIRNPISRKDQLFSISLSTGEKEHVAFAGIIDLDGDGRPDNEDFIRILERNNLVIDSYLDLKTGEIKKRPGTNGIDFKTKFLIIGSDAPQVGNVAKMMEQAKEKGVQMIDARMFLSLIGVKPPKNPAPPAYTTVTLGGEGTKNTGDPDKEPMAPAVPMVPEKKKN
jgi:hypothetical protein